MSRLYRIALGSYCAVHFGTLLTRAPELFSSEGMLPDGGASPLLLPFNVFFWLDGPGFAAATALVATVLGVAIATGTRERAAAAVLCYLHACFLGRNLLILNPALPYLGWLLLAHAAVPARAAEKTSAAVREAGWWLLALGYTYSGAAKLSSASWIDGSAAARILENPLARDTALREWLLALPPEILALATWGTLALELLYAPLALSARCRPWLWSAMVAVHLGLLTLLGFADLTTGMLLVHLFTFEPAWRPASERR